MVFVKKKFMANIYFCVRMVYPLWHSFLYTNAAGKAFSGVKSAFARKGRYEKLFVFVNLFSQVLVTMSQPRIFPILGDGAFH